MSNEVVEFSPEKMAEKIRSRVKAIVTDSMPDEAFDTLIKKEFTSFFEDKLIRKDYGPNEIQPSPFRKLVHKELEEFYGKKVTEYFVQNSQSIWTNNSASAVGKVVEEITPIVITAMAKSIAGHVANTVVSNRAY